MSTTAVPAALPDDPGLVYADSAYRGARFAEAVRARGGVTRVAPTSYWGREADEEAAAAFTAEVRAIQRVRSRIEKIFRNLEAQLRPAPDAMARPRQGRAAGPPDRHRLQSPARRNPVPDRMTPNPSPRQNGGMGLRPGTSAPSRGPICSRPRC